jgi:TP901 family phage tail tape measure protein
MAAAETAKLIAELTLKDNLSKGVRSAVGSVDKLDKAFGRTQTSLGKFGSNLTKGAVIGAAAAAAGFGAVINSARDFESAFAGVRKTIDATEPEFQALSDSIRKMAKEIPISAAELAGLGETAGALGIEGTANIQEFIRVTALLGVTTDLTAQDAATSLGIIANVLHLTGAEYSAFASALVALGNAGASTESQIIEIAQRAGAAGELIGISTEQVLGFSSAVASIGIETEAGGTALQKFFIDTAKFASEGGDELKLLAKISGTSTKQFKKNFDKDAGAALQRFLGRLGELSQDEQLAALEDLGFNDARITRTLLGLANNTKLVSDQMDVATGAFKDNTALTKEAEQRFKTFDSQLQITKNVLNDIGITIGSKLLPKLTPLLQKLNAFVNENQGKIEEFGTKLASGFEEFASAVGKVDWQPFIDGLQLTGQIAKEAIGLFMSLPPDVQKFAIAALAVNKVTGGLGTSIIKDLAGLALGSLKTITAANVTVIGANVTGGGIPPVVGGAAGAAGAAGGTGLIGTLAGAAAKIFPLAIVAGIELSIAEALGPPLREWFKVPDTGLGSTPDPVTGNVVGVSQAAAAHGGLTPEESRALSETPKAISTVGVKVQTAAIAQQEAVDRLAARTGEDIEGATVTLATKTGADLTKLGVGFAGASASEIAAQHGSTTAITAKIAGTSASEASAAAAHAASVAAASRAAGQQAAFAIRDKDLSVTTNLTVNTSVSIRDVAKNFQTYNKLYKTMA